MRSLAIVLMVIFVGFRASAESNVEFIDLKKVKGTADWNEVLSQPVNLVKDDEMAPVDGIERRGSFAEARGRWAEFLFLIQPKILVEGSQRFISFKTLNPHFLGQKNPEFDLTLFKIFILPWERREFAGKTCEIWVSPVSMGVLGVAGGKGGPLEERAALDFHKIELTDQFKSCSQFIFRNATLDLADFSLNTLRLKRSFLY